MWNPFKPGVKRQLEREIAAYQEREQIAVLQAQVARQRNRLTLPGETVATQESVLGMLNTGLGLGTISNMLDPYRELLAIPGMIRERFVYKSAVVRNIQQCDFIRFVGNVLYEECTHFRTAVKVMAAAIFGADGFDIQVVARRNKDVSESHLANLNEVLEEFSKTNRLSAMIKEAHRRYEIQGEVFIRILKDKRDVPATRLAPAQLVIIDPSFIRPSEAKAADFEDPAVGGYMRDGLDWSFGIKNKPLDYTHPLAYQIVWPDGSEEVVPTDEMVHIKLTPFENIKRGVTSAFAIADELVGATVLRAALREGAKVRACIAGVVQHDQAGQDDLSNMVDQLGLTNGTTVTNRTSSDGTPYQITAVNTEVGGILHIGKGSSFVDGPALPDGAEMKTIYDMTLNTIAAHWQIPPPALSGEAAGSAYASALVEENSYTRSREEEQSTHTELWQKVLELVLPYEFARSGYGSENVWKKCDLQVTGPSLVVRDRKSEAETNQMNIQNKLVSRATVQAELGIDAKEEDQKILDDDIGPNAKLDEGAVESTPETTGGLRQKDEG